MIDGGSEEDIQNSVRRVVYVHGLGSGPESPKGLLVRRALSPLGIETEIPNLTIPDFTHLSPHSVVDAVVARLRRGDVEGVVASSFGAFVLLRALSKLSREVRPRRAVFLAPLVDPWAARHPLLAPELEAAWMERGSLPFHCGAIGAEAPVWSGFLVQLRELAPLPDVPDLPALIVHGVNDTLVHPSQSEMLHSRIPSSKLLLVEDDHDLLAHPAVLEREIAEFIGSP